MATSSAILSKSGINDGTQVFLNSKDAKVPVTLSTNNPLAEGILSKELFFD